MAAAQGFLAEAVADWDGLFAGGSLLAMKEHIDRFGAAWAGLDSAWIGGAQAWFVIQWVARLCALMMAASKWSMRSKLALMSEQR